MGGPITTAVLRTPRWACKFTSLRCPENAKVFSRVPTFSVLIGLGSVIAGLLGSLTGLGV
jgi:hypothetical protein